MAKPYTPSRDLTLYYHAQSTACVSVGVLNELGIKGKRVDLKLMSTEPGGSRHTDFLKVNPNGRVPALVHEGESIWEAAAITLYVGELFGVEAGLWPPPGPQRGQAMKWVVWASTSLQGAAIKIHLELPPGHGGAVPEGAEEHIEPEKRSNERLSAARTSTDAMLKILDDGLTGREFLLGGGFTLVDAHMAMIMGWVQMMGVKLDAYANVGPWLNRCLARPALARVYE